MNPLQRTIWHKVNSNESTRWLSWFARKRIARAVYKQVMVDRDRRLSQIESRIVGGWK